jgi:exonuclease VII large subunit
MSRMRHELSDLRHRLAEHEPRSVVRIAAHDLAAAERGLAAAMERRIKAAAGRIGEAERVLKAVGPASVLQRGFGYVTDEAGRLVRSVEQVAAGMVVTTTVSDGQFRSQVVGEVSEGGKKGDAGGAGAAGGVKKGAVRRVAKQRDRDGGGSDGAGLFGAT